MATQDELLSIEELSVTLPARGGRVAVLERVSFRLKEHEFVGLVGESGSGKTMTALAVTGFLHPSARVLGGKVWFRGQELLSASPEMRATLRGRGIAMIFQNPPSALNPLMRVGDQVTRVFRIQCGLGPEAARRRALEMLQRVGISDAAMRAQAYPYQLSGGMTQRVLVAMMLACQPELLIADEPTTGLDVTIQAQIFELLKDIQVETGASVLLITHDLGVVAETCQRVVVMYAGQIMEIAESASIFARPQHPYTERLLGSVLRVDRVVRVPVTDALPSEAIIYAAQGCRFAGRCPYAREVCRRLSLPAVETEPGHLVMCHKFWDKYANSPEG